MSVINGDESPAEAIHLIEDIELSPPPSDPDISNNLADNQPPTTPQRKKVKSKPSPPTESPPPSPIQATESEKLGRLTKEEMLKFRDRIPR
ncbi:hypothetical protein [Limnofasciculus baicalensis]|uniref:Uncharacterized protein n=1 Tax=Limnofasciculus baicalensis BBK-W-15 TaxID=2699891 RepID=A0AAE3KRS6_9CYAN|nr:hypothetical protein [Limnofasciculus baicalensis]MCP2728747.1 hypothetical protein [Limnofasciculus baicalensis BBK-W-15]